MNIANSALAKLCTDSAGSIAAWSGTSITSPAHPKLREESRGPKCASSITESLNTKPTHIEPGNRINESMRTRLCKDVGNSAAALSGINVKLPRRTRERTDGEKSKCKKSKTSTIGPK